MNSKFLNDLKEVFKKHEIKSIEPIYHDAKMKRHEDMMIVEGFQFKGENDKRA